MDPSLSFPLPNRRATKRVAERLAALLGGGDLVIFEGPLGCGKTFFVRALCRALGLPQDERVTSPTFTLVIEHEARLRVVHSDLYRIEGDSAQRERAVRGLGLFEMRDAGRVLLVEWGEPYLRMLGGDALLGRFELDPRRLHFTASGARSSATLAALRNALPVSEAQGASH